MIPRKEVEEFKDLFEKAFKAADPESTPFSFSYHTTLCLYIASFEIMGSFRRGEEVSSDIDVVVWHPYVLLAHYSRQPVLTVDHSSLGIKTKRGLRR